MLPRCLLGGWALWFAIVATTNLCDLLRAVGVLAPSFGFASGNLELIAHATHAGAGFNRVLFVGVIAWEAAAAAFMAWASWRRPASPLPFVVAMTLFLSFMISDELTLSYGAQGAHAHLFIALGVTLLVTRT